MLFTVLSYDPRFGHPRVLLVGGLLGCEKIIYWGSFGVVCFCDSPFVGRPKEFSNAPRGLVRLHCPPKVPPRSSLDDFVHSRRSSDAKTECFLYVFVDFHIFLLLIWTLGWLEIGCD